MRGLEESLAMPDFTFHIGINQRNYFDYVIEAEDLEAARTGLVGDMAEHSDMHIFDVTFENGDKEELEEDIEFPNERVQRIIQENLVRVPLVAILANTLPYLNALRDFTVETQNISELIREIETEINKTMKNKG